MSSLKTIITLFGKIFLWSSAVMFLSIYLDASIGRSPNVLIQLNNYGEQTIETLIAVLGFSCAIVSAIWAAIKAIEERRVHQ